MRTSKLFLALIVAGLAAETAARAELPSLFGLGAKSQAMGGVGVIQGEPSATQVYSAPAALGYLRRVEIGFAAQQMQANLKPYGTLVLNSGGTRGDFNDAGVLNGGGSVIDFGIPIGKTRPVVLGGAIYMPFTTMIRVSGTPVDYPFYPLYTDISRNFFFVVGAGYEFVDGWSFGVNVRSTTKSTVSYVLRTDSSVNYSASATEAKSQSRLSYSILYDNARRHPESPWTVGAMYRGHAGMETKIEADVTAFVPVQGVLVSMPAYTPAEWAAMGSFKAVPWFTISGEVARVKWSQYVSPYGSGNINSYVIGSRASQANFHDITVWKFGMEQVQELGGSTVKKIYYREGYQYHPTPVPDQTGDTNFVDTNRHMFSAGVGLGIVNPWKEDDLFDLDFFFQYNLLKNRQISKAASNNVGAPGYLAGGNILLFGGGVTMRF